MSTLGVVIIIVLAVGLAFWFFNRKPETFSENTDKPEEAPYKVPEPAATTPIPMVVETAPVIVPAVVEEKPVKEKKASKSKVAAKKASTAKATTATKAVKKPKLKTAK